MQKAGPFSTERSKPEPERFDLRVERFGDEWRAQVQGAWIRDAEVRFPNPFSEKDLEQFRRAAERPPADREVVRNWEDLQDVPGRLGALLYRTVFTGGVLEAWRESLGRASEARKRLILALDLRDPEAARWPWEYLYQPKEKHFLGLSKQTPVVRYSGGEVRLRPSPPGLPVRVLVVFANPWRSHSLEGEREWNLLRAALLDLVERGLVRLDRLDVPTFPSFERKLSEETYHIFHFIGHGGFDGRSGSLFFEDDRGEPVEVSAESLGSILHDAGLRLAVLNSCHGGQAAQDDLLSGVAQSLIQNNTEAVIAMQFSVPDASAIRFSEALYEELAKGSPLDLAITDARRALFAAETGGGWGNPVLYLRTSHVSILPPQAMPPPRTPVRILAVLLALTILAALVLPVFRNEYPGEQGAEAPAAGPVPLYAAPPPGSHPRCPSPQSTDIRFALIEPGELVLSTGKRGRLLKLPQPLCVSIYETTRRQWAEVMGVDSGPRPELPITFKSYNDALRFVEKLNERDPEARYRLPTESEWEFAGRAESADDFSFGDDPGLLHRYANCGLGRFFDGESNVAPVGKYRPNKWGLYDMQGNVWEWVAPDPGDSDSLPRRKGGSWGIMAEHCTLARFVETKPHSSKKDYGFRVVREPLPEEKKAAQGPPSNPQP